MISMNQEQELPVALDEWHAKFKADLAGASDEQLIASFNRETGHNGWTSTRGAYLKALHEEFDRRGFDYSCIGDSRSLSFSRRIRLVGKTIELD
jgi:hypothetical protein